MSKPKTVHFILNASSGLNEKADAAAVLRRAMTEAGMEAEIHEVSKDVDLCELTRRIVRDGAEVIAAGGGDGTINAVASVLAGTEVALGILPMGTLNHFARDLQIPFDLSEAAKVIAGGRAIQVDVGEVNGRRFINNAIIGLYPVYRFSREKNQQQGRRKWLAMASAVYGVVRRNPAFEVQVEAEGKQISRRTPFLMVANNVHEMEGYQLGTRKSCADGVLALYMMHRMSRLRLMRLAFSVLLGRFSKSRDFDLLNAREITLVSRRRRLGISLDGEVIRMETPFHYKSLAGALRVLVPPTYSARA